MRSLAFLTVLSLAGAAHADVGVLPSAVEGFEPAVASEHRQQLDNNVRDTLGDRHVMLALKPGCSTADAGCIAAAASGVADIEEVTQVILQRLGPDLSKMTLRVWSAAGSIVFELVADIPSEASIDTTTALLRRAFDPARYRGTVEIEGAPEGAELLVDGLRLEEPRAQLRVGEHVLDVVLPDRQRARVPFTVELERNTEVVVPPIGAAVSAPPAPLPLYVATGVAAAGAVSAVGFGVAFVVAEGQLEAWRDRATGTALVSREDPLCNTADCGRLGWQQHYGPPGAKTTAGDRQIGVGARFMQVAISRDQQQDWAARRHAVIGLGIGAAVATLGGGVASFVLWSAAAGE